MEMVSTFHIRVRLDQSGVIVARGRLATFRGEGWGAASVLRVCISFVWLVLFLADVLVLLLVFSLTVWLAAEPLGLTSQACGCVAVFV